MCRLQNVQDFGKLKLFTLEQCGGPPPTEFYPGDYVVMNPKNPADLIKYCYEYFDIKHPSQYFILKGNNIPKVLREPMSYKKLFEEIIDL
jgi:hypothetical protein